MKITVAMRLHVSDLTRHPLRLPALLLLVYPLTLAYDFVAQGLDYGWVLAPLDSLALVGVLLLLAIGLWVRAPWAYNAASVASTFIAVILGLKSATRLRELVWKLVVELAVGARGDWSAAAYRFVASLVAPTSLILTFVLLRQQEAVDAVVSPPQMKTLRRLIVSGVSAELVLVVLIAVLGWGLPDMYWYRAALWYTQMPGVVLLSAMGLWGGFNDLVITDFGDAHWGTLTAIGVPILTTANALCLIALAGIAGVARRRLQGGCCGLTYLKLS